MKDGWPRETPHVGLELDAITHLLQPALHGRRAVQATPIDSGLRNTNTRIRLSDGTDVLLRLFTHGADVAMKEAAIARLVGDRVPVARFLHVAPTNDVTGHAYAVLEWIDGTLLQSAVPELGADLEAIARALGATLAALASFRFSHAGFFDGGLAVAEPIDVGSRGFLAYARAGLGCGLGRERIGAALADRVLAFAERAAGILDAVAAEPPSLVHSDFDVSNLLVRRTPAGWVVGAVLDWEFAYSGSILADVGHILRRPLGPIDGFAEQLAHGFTTAGGRLPARWLDVAQLLDSLAWIEFATRPSVNDRVVSAAREALGALLNIQPSRC